MFFECQVERNGRDCNGMDGLAGRVPELTGIAVMMIEHSTRDAALLIL